MKLNTEEKQIKYTYQLADVLGINYDDDRIISRLERIKKSFQELDKMVDTTVSH